MRFRQVSSQLISGYNVFLMNSSNVKVMKLKDISYTLRSKTFSEHLCVACSISIFYNISFGTIYIFLKTDSSFFCENNVLLLLFLQQKRRICLDLINAQIENKLCRPPCLVLLHKSGLLKRKKSFLLPRPRYIWHTVNRAFSGNFNWVQFPLLVPVWKVFRW